VPASVHQSHKSRLTGVIGRPFPPLAGRGQCYGLRLTRVRGVPRADEALGLGELLHGVL